MLRGVLECTIASLDTSVTVQGALCVGDVEVMTGRFPRPELFRVGLPSLSKHRVPTRRSDITLQGSPASTAHGFLFQRQPRSNAIALANVVSRWQEDVDTTCLEENFC